MKRMLNIGCGARYHPDFVNIDLYKASNEVDEANIKKPLVFEDNSFDVIYLSHLLEHLNREEGEGLLKECYRVSKPGGIVRVVVPDLEEIVEEYQQCLRSLEEGDKGARYKHEWIVMELYDQAVREKSGGSMVDYVRRAPQEMNDYLQKRLGEIFYSLKEYKEAGGRNVDATKLNGVFHSWGNLRLLVRLLFTKTIMAIIWGKDGKGLTDLIMLQITGEKHKFMYDRYSLSRTLEEAGFIDVVICSCSESRIEGWERFNLDTSSEGKIYKPGSLYCEAEKRIEEL
jgi:predicted SAM-dependent methyltransferase